MSRGSPPRGPFEGSAIAILALRFLPQKSHFVAKMAYSVNLNGETVFDRGVIFQGLMGRSQSRSEAKHARQSRPESGIAFQAKVLKTFEGVPSSLQKEPSGGSGV